MANSNNLYNVQPSVVNNGIYLDCDPKDQPNGTRRFTLNAIDENNSEGNRVYNEGASITCTTFPIGYYPVGHRYIQDNETFVILVNPNNNKNDIGIIGSNDKYTTLINTGILNIKITNQCDIRFRVRRGNERVFYWVDGLNNARSFNIDRIYNYYTNAYKDYLSIGGDPNAYALEKYDSNSFDLIKTYSMIPTFNSVDILEYGSILPGSYNFSIQYIDEDLNPTNWITTSNIVRIYNDSVNNPFERIRGSKNIDNVVQSFTRANKSISLTIGNLDDKFPYYRIAIMRAAGTNGVVEKVLVSDLSSTSESNFIYSGNDDSLTGIELGDILIDKQLIISPKHIEQIENSLLLANTKDKDINWCDFQQYASKISSDLVTKEVILNSVSSDANVKNARSTFMFRGYMPGEVYSFGIVYIFSDGTQSPVFHIPGKNSLNTLSKMKYYEINNKYISIHNCSTNNYWNKDSMGYTLVNKNIRHHRFPFRDEVNKPLVSTDGSSTYINKYKLSITISLAAGQTYPVDSDGNPISISYRFSYRLDGSASDVIISGNLVDTDMNGEIVLYDDTTELQKIYNSDTQYEQLDPTSQLSTEYMIVGMENFVITETYSPHSLETVTNTDKSEIFGISFSNIEVPHPDVVGFFIVRNERTDSDRIVVDNAIFGPTIENEQFRSFGLIMPKQFYSVNNCGHNTVMDVIHGLYGYPDPSLVYHNKATWFFNPEYEYLQKKAEFTDIKISGKYTEKVVNMPTISNITGSPCNSGGSKGVYINDVQAGTSYDPDVNKRKDKDDDGFDLIIGYRNTDVTYSNHSINLPELDKTFYLNAASYQNYNNGTYYNVSVDNKIGMYIFKDTINTEEFYSTSSKKNSLLYGSLITDNTSAYSNFMTRSYYKEHNNPILFGSSTVLNNVEVYNGDAEISAFNFVSSVYYNLVSANREKKSGIWKIIVGAVLVVVGVVAAIWTGGTSLALAGLGLGLMAVSYGVSLAVAGINQEQLGNMINTDYEKGLKETVTDGGVYECLRDKLSTDDDTIRWFCDMVSSIYMETTIPFGLRCGSTSGITDFVDSPQAQFNESNFINYVTNKLTSVDRDQKSGRLYMGFASAEYYDINLDYMRFNKEKIFTHLPVEYDCCSDSKNSYPRRIWNSQKSFQEEKTDNYAAFLPNNYVDIEGQYGEITNMYMLGNNLFIHTKEGLWQLPQNNQERVTGEIVTFIGTGSLFSLLPRKVIDADPGSGGCSHKWATIKTPIGVFFISERERNIYIHGDKVRNISVDGLNNYFQNNLKSFLDEQLYSIFNINFPNVNNPANPFGTGYISFYDKRFNRIVFTKRDYLIREDKIGNLVVFDNTQGVPDGFSYNKDAGLFFLEKNILPFEDSNYFENKSYTLSYSLNKKGNWSSWHSYIPLYYMFNQNSIYTYINQDSKYNNNSDNNYLNKLNSITEFNTYFGIKYTYIIEGVKKVKSIEDEITDDLTFYTEARVFDNNRKGFYDIRDITFNKITLSNTRQCSGEIIIVPKSVYDIPNNYLTNQVKNTSNMLLLDRKGRNWNLNGFRDYVYDYTMSMFSENWDDIKNDYFIDKVVNNSIINLNKNWYELESFKDKFLLFRLSFDTFNNINLIMDFSLFTDETSNI